MQEVLIHRDDCDFVKDTRDFCSCGALDNDRPDSGTRCAYCFVTNGHMPGCPVDKPASIAALVKNSNPKDAIGALKAPFSTVPMPVVAEIGLGMLEGACKYGRHNYREIGVRASVYYDAAVRHLASWWEGQDIDPDSGVHHVTKALSCLVVLRDAMMNDKVSDDRPPAVRDQDWIAHFNERAKAILEKYPNPQQPYTSTGRGAP